MKPIRNNEFRAAAERGFTILEVVVAMIIISILTLIMLPTVTNRSRQARLTAAENDLRVLAEAQSRASIDLDYYVAPWRLNNVIGGGTRGTQSSPNPSGDLTDPDAFFIDVISLDIPNNITDIVDNFRDNETNFGWRGPYINFQRDEDGDNWPEDPWGNEYILFTKAGGLFPSGVQNDSFQGTGPDFTPIGGGAAVNIDGLVDAFDRPVWVSLGPNGLPGNGVGAGSFGDESFYTGGDDLFIEFEGFDAS